MFIAYTCMHFYYLFGCVLFAYLWCTKKYNPSIEKEWGLAHRCSLMIGGALHKLDIVMFCGWCIA